MDKSQKLYSQALNAYNAGNSAKAKALLLQLLQKDNRHFEALNFLGVLALESDRLEEAERFFLKALEQNPRNAETHNNLGNLYAKTKEPQKALSSFDHAIRCKPSFAKAHYNKATVLKEISLFEQAIEGFQKALELEPNMAQAHINMGLCLKELGDIEGAKLCYERALSTGSHSEEALINLGVTAKDSGDVPLALEYYEQALQLNKNSASAYNNIGVALQSVKRYDDSIGFFTQAVMLNPNYGDAFVNLGVSLMEKKEYTKAKGAFAKAIAIDPKNPHAYINYGVFAKRLGELDEAQEAFSQALAHSPSNAVAKTNLGVLLMMRGDYKNGLPLYESRQTALLECDRPLWRGEDLSGKTVAIYHEQGFGDTIQFAALLPKLAQMCEKAIFIPQEELLDIFDPVALCAQLLSPSEFVQTSPHFDYHLPLLSLLLRLGIEPDAVPSRPKIVRKNSQKREEWQKRLEPYNEAFKIGFAWQGNPKHTGDAQRSAPLSAFGPLADIKGVQLISIQKELNHETFDDFAAKNGAVEFSKYLHDFSDTAALIEQLDLVITIDTSVAHLAAACGKRVWLLVAKVPDWRWGLDGDTTHWYENVTIFRQSDFDDWSGPLSSALRELQILLQCSDKPS